MFNLARRVKCHPVLRQLSHHKTFPMALRARAVDFDSFFASVEQPDPRELFFDDGDIPGKLSAANTNVI